jgi:2-(1,2-epoxy-1,2-dihydrophenyl)acetyl-CoA isomerase
MSFTTIQVETADGVATITLDRPDKLNSFNETMHAELRNALTAIEGDAGVRAVLLTGAGRGFCAGQDLADVLPDEDNLADSDGAELGDILERNYNPLVRRLRALNRPIIAAVNGVAAGAGANIALACDIVIAARSAKFIQAFCKIGLVPDSGGTHTLPRLVGPARAAGLAMLGEAIDADTAAQWGLIWKSVDDDALMTEAGGLAHHLATQPTRALGLIKRALNESASNDLDAQLDLEYELQRIAASTDDYAEGVAAFLAKRPPVFRGR